MKMPRTLVCLLGLAGCSVVAIACGSSPNDGETTPPAAGPSAGSSGFGSGGPTGPSDQGPACAATVTETEKAKVDIVFVIDDSPSMKNEMEQVKLNVNSFASKIGGSGLDYRVIFLAQRATSPADTGNVICVPPPLGGADCADNPPRFRHVDQLVRSKNSLDVILSTYDSADKELAWSRFLRPRAYKVFVEVTDDQSSLPTAQFDSALLAKTPARMFGTAASRKYVFHSIVGWQEGTPLLSDTKCSTAVATGSVYQELSKLTGGIVDSVCKPDFSGTLDNIAKGINEKVGCAIDVPTAVTADPTKMVVRSTEPGGAETKLTQVTDASKCATTANAWYYDDNANPSSILLCPSTCAAANAKVGTKIEALVGCAAPPPR
jgi:hypothetical protein